MLKYKGNDKQNHLLTTKTTAETKQSNDDFFAESNNFKKNLKPVVHIFSANFK